MAKKRTEKVAETVESLRPYLERALKDDDFREDLRDALETAREIYGEVSKKRNGGITTTATKIATDKDLQEQVRRALEDLGRAGERLQGKKQSKKGRRTLLLAGVIAGALYNPWTGPQTRQWLMDKLSGEDELTPLDTFEAPSYEPAAGETATAAATPESTPKD
jgi:hypothetical protein